MSMFLTAATNQAIFSFAHRETPQKSSCKIQERREDPVHCPHVVAYLKGAGPNGSNLERLIVYKTAMARARTPRAFRLLNCCFFQNFADKKIGIRHNVAYTTPLEEFSPQVRISRLFNSLHNVDQNFPLFDVDRLYEWEIQRDRAHLATQLNALGSPYRISVPNTAAKTILEFFNKLEVSILGGFFRASAPDRYEEVRQIRRNFNEAKIVLPSERKKKGIFAYIRREIMRSQKPSWQLDADLPAIYPEGSRPTEAFYRSVLNETALSGLNMGAALSAEICRAKRRY